MLGRFRIRTRIAIGSLVVALLLAVPSGLVLDAQIRHIVRLGTAGVLKTDQQPYAVDIRQGRVSEFEKPAPGERLAVLGPDGTVHADTLPRRIRGSIDQLIRDDETKHVVVGGTGYLVRAMPVATSGGTWYVIAARDASSEEAVLGPMRLLLVGVLVIVVAGVAFGAWLLAAISLRPVTRMRETASVLSTASGDELLPVGRTDDEIARLAVTLNGLVTRLRAAAERERRLVSDASHELRTPVAVVRTQLELARSGAGDAAALRRDIAEAEAGVVRLGALLDSLLELSAIEASGAVSTSVGAAEEEVQDAVDRAGFRAGAAALRLETDVPDDLRARRIGVGTDGVGRIVDNLVSNTLAALDGRPGSILVSLSADGADVRLAVVDDAGGLPDGFADVALERFTRGTATRRGTGAGLGLAIVAALVEAADGGIRMDDRPGEGLTVTITLPMLDPE